MDDMEYLDNAKYISFATLKRSGDFVATPVWFAKSADRFYIFTAGDSGKVKRLRNFSESWIAPCTFNGTITGEKIQTQAYILDDPAEIVTRGKAGYSICVPVQHRNVLKVLAVF